MTQHLIKLIRILSLNKIALFTITIFVTIVGFTFWENREKLADLKFFTSKIEIFSQYTLIWEMSEDNKKALQSIVQSDNKIAGGAVFSADIRYNEARPVFFYSKDSLLASSVAFATESRSSRIPLFSFMENNNLTIIKLINGQFNCFPFAQSNLSILYPELNGVFKYTCMAGIPSYYGYFSGYVTLYFSEVPSSEKQQQFELVMEKLANEIYFKDVVRTQKLEKINTPVRLM